MALYFGLFLSPSLVGFSVVVRLAPLIGFYSQHYVEYLVDEIAKANIDSLPILDLTDCMQELRRSGIALPERGPWDTEEIYRGMCQKVSPERTRDSSRL